jgi:hypothetical protein
MLIIYRTNKDFEGQIITLDKLSSPGEVDKWLAGEVAKGKSESAYIEVNEAQMDQAVLADLAASKDKYRVRAGKLERDAKPVALGYDEAKIAASPAKALKELTTAAATAVKVAT